MAVLRSKQLDLNRLKELCQPRKVEGPVLSPLKPKPILTEAQIQRQNDSIKRLSKGYKKPAAESQMVALSLKMKINKDKKLKEEKESRKRQNQNNGKVLAITANGEPQNKQKTIKAQPMKAPQAKVAKPRNPPTLSTRQRSEHKLKTQLQLKDDLIKQ